MTLKEKFEDITEVRNHNHFDILVNKLEKIADDYAIEFVNFIQDNCDTDNYNNTYWYYDKQEKKEINLTVKELLEIFKKEKGL